MADFWKSTPKKYCEFCKVWFADNKSSIAFHSNGLKHKASVERRIRESRNKHTNEGVADSELRQQMKDIEESALKKMQVDISQNPDLANTDSVYSALQKKRPSVVGYSTAANLDNLDHILGTDWTRKKTQDGLHYYYNMVTGAASWDHPNSKKKGFRPDLDRMEKKEEKKVLEKRVWLKQLTEDGHEYYYNTQTQLSQWEKPDNLDDKVAVELPDPSAPAPAWDDVDEPTSKRSKKEHPTDGSSEAGEEGSHDTRGDGDAQGDAQSGASGPTVYATPELDVFSKWETVEPEPEPEPAAEEQPAGDSKEGILDAHEGTVAGEAKEGSGGDAAASEGPKDATSQDAAQTELPNELPAHDQPISFSVSASGTLATGQAFAVKAARPAAKAGASGRSMAEQRKIDEAEITFESKAMPAMRVAVKSEADGPPAIARKAPPSNTRQRPRKAF